MKVGMQTPRCNLCFGHLNSTIMTSVGIVVLIIEQYGGCANCSNVVSWKLL